MRPRSRGRRAAIGAAAAAGLAALATTAALAFAGGGTSPARGGRPGPEGVAVPDAAALPLARVPRPGEQVDGVSCEPAEQAVFHVHVHLSIFVRGAARRVPAGIGIGAPVQVARTSRGVFVVGGSCFSWLHTHAADGVIHVEAPVQQSFTLGDFFDVWGQRLDRTRVGPARGRVTALVDGREYHGDLRLVPLRGRSEIQLDVGRRVAFEPVALPDGL